MCERKKITATYCEDIQNVKCLPDEIENIGTLSIIDIHKQKYEQAMVDMRNDINQTCLSIDKEANVLMELANEDLEMIEQETDLHINSVNQWKLAYKKSKDLLTQTMSAIDKCYDELKSLEQKRKKEILETLSKCKEKIVKTSYINNKSMEEVFLAELDCINRRILSNLQKYEDHYLNLQVRARAVNNANQHNLKETAKRIADKEAQCLWKTILAKQNKKNLLETVSNLTLETLEIRGDISQAMDTLVGSLTDLSEVFDLSEVVTIHENLLGNWIERLISRLEGLDVMCKNLTSLFENAVATLMEIFDSKINSLSRQLATRFKVSQARPELDDLSSAEIDMFNSHQVNEFGNLRNAGKEIVDIIGVKIIRAKQFVGDLRTMCTDHLHRTEDMHQRLQSEWNEFHSACLNHNTDAMAKIKNQTKIIREAKDLKNLNYSAECAGEIIKEMEQKYQLDFESKINVLTDIKNKCVEKIVEEDLSNIDAFLHIKYPKRDLLSAKQVSPPNLENNENDFVTQIDICNTFMAAVDNRILGMFEMVERFLPQCKEKAMKETDDWYELFLRDIVSKHGLELRELHDTQKANISELKNLRSAELMYHSHRLQSHSLGVKAAVTELDHKFQEVNTTTQFIEADLSEKMIHLTQELPAESSKDIRDVISKLENLWFSSKQQSESCIAEATLNCEETFNAIKQSNDLFLNAVKSFKNGGNYSPEELKNVTKELRQIEKYYTAQKIALLKKYSGLKNRLTRQLLDSKIDQLNDKLAKATFQETISNTLAIVRANLRAEVTHMNEKGREIGDKINYYLSYLSKLDDTLVNDIVGMIRLRYEYMVFPPGMVSFEPLSPSNYLSSKMSYTKPEETQKKGKKNIKPGHSRTVPLFTNTNNDIITYEHNYFVRTKGLMMKKYKDLIQYIQSTLTSSVGDKTTRSSMSKRSVSNQDLLAEHSNKLASVLLGYNTECESAWYCEVTEFIDQINYIKENVNFLIDSELQNIHKKYIAHISLIEREFQYIFERTEIEQAKIRESIVKKLALPLAHPNHHHKLDELHVRATNLCEMQNCEFRNLVEAYKDTLQRKHDEYVSVVKVLKERLTNIQSLTMNTCKFDNLFDNYKAVTHLVKSDVMMKHESDEEQILEYPKSIWFSDADSSYTCSSRTARISENYKYSTNFNITVLENTTEKVKESALIVQKLYDEVKLSLTNNENLIDQWLKSFERNVDQCTQIYKSLCN